MKPSLVAIYFISIQIVPAILFGQHNQKIARMIAFYNVENLFDTIDAPDVFDDDFTPQGRNNYDFRDYKSKIHRLAEVISKIGIDNGFMGPDLIGLAEVENKSVIIDLVNTELLARHQYGIIHFDSPDRRGIDVALLYKQNTFAPIHYSKNEVKLWKETGERIYTRDILRVSGILDGELIHLLVNHWPSRRGGSMKSYPKRMKAAYVVQNILEEILVEDPDPKIIIMGDFNDDPIDKSIVQGLVSPKNPDTTGVRLFNPMKALFNKGFNTLAYRDNLNLFDQIILSESLLPSQMESNSFHLYQTGIFNPSFLTNQTGKYKGYPKRSFEHNKYVDGYSDHYPVFIIMIKNR